MQNNIIAIILISIYFSCLILSFIGPICISAIYYIQKGKLFKSISYCIKHWFITLGVGILSIFIIFLLILTLGFCISNLIIYSPSVEIKFRYAIHLISVIIGWGIFISPILFVKNSIQKWTKVYYYINMFLICTTSSLFIFLGWKSIKNWLL